MHDDPAGPAAHVAQPYIWANISPLDRFPPSKFSPLPNQLAEDFAKRAIEAQPLAYAQTVAYDTARVFEWRRYVYPNAQTYDEYLFGYRSHPSRPGPAGTSAPTTPTSPTTSAATR